MTATNIFYNFVGFRYSPPFFNGKNSVYKDAFGLKGAPRTFQRLMNVPLLEFTSMQRIHG